jgi:hypothetical protein
MNPMEYNNRLVVDNVFYSVLGLSGGLFLSMFFKRKLPILAYSTGFGLGLAMHHNGSDLIKHIRRSDK